MPTIHVNGLPRRPSDSPANPRNHVLARRAKKRGMKNSLRIVCEARHAKLPISLAFAIVERETGNGSNIFGHDRTIFVGAGEVTKAKYLDYAAQRDRTGECQGVGPVQLTYDGYQKAADQLGGCWKPKWSLRVGFNALAANIKAYGMHDGVKAYNGTGHAAESYADDVIGVKVPKWHKALSR